MIYFKTSIYGASLLLLMLFSYSGFTVYKGHQHHKATSHQVAGIVCAPETPAAYQPGVVSDLGKKLLRCNRRTDHKVIAGFVTEARNSGIHSADIAEILSSMLPYQAEIYQNRDKWEVLRLRAYILLALGETGFPGSAIPILVDALAYVDERMNVVELGSAIKVVGSLGAKGSLFGESMISAFNRVFSDEEFSLETYQVVFSKDKATTVQLEIVRALGKICNGIDDYAIKFLQSILSSSDSGIDRRVVAAARLSLDCIIGRAGQNVSAGQSDFYAADVKKAPTQSFSSLDDVQGSPYINAQDRKALTSKNILLTDQNGKAGELLQLIDRPTLLTFFYTRCQNDSKCSATVSQLASLQNDLSRFLPGNKVRLIGISFESLHDSPDLLKRYFTDRGVKFGNDAIAVKLETAGQQALFNELQVPVGYSSGWVNGHGIEAVLIDKGQRIVRKYSFLFWNSSAVLADFSRLLKEQDGE